MPSRPFLLAGAAMIAAGAAAIGYAVTRSAGAGMSETQTAAMIGAVAKLDGDINAARSAVHERAATLSGLQAVRAAAATDAATAADMVTRGELAFSPGAGEVVELGHVVKATGAVVSLMRQPADRMAMSHKGVPGAYAELV